MSQSEVKKWWIFSATVLALVVSLAVGTWGFTAPRVSAAPNGTRAVSHTEQVQEGGKEVLPETSIDGPAFSSLSDYVPSSQTFPPGTFPATVIAWTGTDTSHSLNVIESGDGITYTKNKITLQEFSDARPAVLLYNNNHIGTLAPNLVVLAWTGTDPNHSLNVLFDVYGARQMVTLGENSFYSPALAYYKGQIWLAWTGTDPNHSLNVMAMGIDGVTPGQKTILSGPGVSSIRSPSLREDMRDNLLLLTWSMRTSLPYIDLAQSADGVNWTPSFTPPPPQTSMAAPDVLSVPGTLPAGVPTYYWSWAGTDVSHSLNLAFTSTLASWPAPIVTLNEQAFGSPAIGYSNKLGLAQNGNVMILIAWAGTDSAHHLNIAILTISAGS
jgi:hypothetical protein